MNAMMKPPFLVLTLSLVVLWLSVRIGVSLRKRRRIATVGRGNTSVMGLREVLMATAGSPQGIRPPATFDSTLSRRFGL